MDDILLAVSILENFDEITQITSHQSELKYITFKVDSHKFLMFCPEQEAPSSRVTIFAADDVSISYPHIMTGGFDVAKGKKLPEGNYRLLCLYEKGSMIFSLFSFEEKIIDAVERLLELLKLSQLEIEKELQKEFLYYWNGVAVDDEINLYIGEDKYCKKLNVYYGRNEIRCVSVEIRLNDRSKKDGEQNIWKHRPDICAYYIPIVDNRGILPPTKGSSWGKKELLNIVYGKQINHISEESFAFIESEQVKAPQMILSFGMVINGVTKVFSLIVTFRKSSKSSIMDKLLRDVDSIKIVKSKRQDYYALSEAIGNRVDLMSKKMLIVGAGSLGSYVASEIVKNGINSITVYDGDKLEPDNMMRWSYGGFGQGLAKPEALKLFLEFLHPEIHVNAVGNNLDGKALIKEISNHDIVIFTIGSSDEQLDFNRLLKNSGCSVPVIYTWIEAGGEYSHILKIEYSRQGCFQCLYTDEEGILENNKANLLQEDQRDELIIRNGCGGTRAPYGTAVLLRTVSILLDVIEDTFENENSSNYLLTISKQSGYSKSYDFIERMCKCCGNNSDK